MKYSMIEEGYSSGIYEGVIGFSVENVKFQIENEELKNCAFYLTHRGRNNLRYLSVAPGGFLQKNN